MRALAVPDAASAVRALDEASVSDTPYQLVVLDLCMPGTDGLQLAAQIRDGGAGMVLLTSGPELAPEEFRAVGITQSLRKPARLSHLSAALHEALATSDVRPEVVPVEEPAGATTLGLVLVVEDNEINQLVTCGLLEHLGYTQEVASNGLEALAALERTEFAAVLMDCQMPEMDGYAATRELRSRTAGGRHVPVIAMTAGVTDGEREMCFEAGMDDYVAKPVDVAQLSMALSRWVAAPGPQRASVG